MPVKINRGGASRQEVKELRKEIPAEPEIPNLPFPGTMHDGVFVPHGVKLADQLAMRAIPDFLRMSA